jgi:hypothetical protein
MLASPSDEYHDLQDYQDSQRSPRIPGFLEIFKDLQGVPKTKLEMSFESSSIGQRKKEKFPRKRKKESRDDRV